MKIKTKEFKELVSKVSIGIGGDKLMPITELMCISNRDGKVTLITTDATNYVYAEGNNEDKNDFDVVIFAEQLVKLVGKLTSEYITFEIEQDNLVISANGKYTVELPLDENGEFIKYPNPREDMDTNVKPVEISIDDIKKAIQIAKPSLATTLERPVLTNYYVGDTVFATNGVFVTEYREKLFDTPQLISAKLMDIIGSFTANKATVMIDDKYIYVTCGDVAVYSKVNDDVDEYALDSVTQFISTQFDHSCKVNTSEFISVLDRISLFVSKYDNDAIRLTFDKDSIAISNVKSGSNEAVGYVEKKSKSKKKFEAFEVYINAKMLMDQLKAYVGENVTVEYGTDFAISLVSEDTTQIISLMEV